MTELKKRKCSLCNRAGHTKRSCKKKLSEPKKHAVQPHVFVRIGEENNQSPHVINLRPSGVSIEQVKAFRDAYAKRVKREIVDWAALVRNANKSAASNQHNAGHNFKLKENIEFGASVNPAGALSAESRSPRDFDFKLRKEKSHILSGLKERLKDIGSSAHDFSRNSYNFFSARRFAYCVVVFLLVAVIPFPAVGYYNKLKKDGAELVSQSTNAFMFLQSSTIAAFQSDMLQAKSDLNSALSSFEKAETFIEKDYNVLTFVAGMVPVIGQEVKSRQNVLSAGHHLALGNTYLVKGIEKASAESLNTTDRFQIIKNHLNSAIPQYKTALADLGYVKPSSLPAEYQASFDDFKVLFATFIDDMENLVELTDVISSLFGKDEFKRYLVMFQNNHEIRPTGGFLGSFAVVDVQKGKILNIQVPGGGTYDINGQLNVNVIPPLPLQIANNRWEFQDANWFPDFSASAKKISWFYMHGAGSTVDGVIAINASVLQRFLAVIGPVSNDKYDLLLDANNVLENLQYQVEVNYDKQENKPKQIIADMLDQFLSYITEVDTISAIRLLTELHEAAEQREIQIYSDEVNIQEKLRSFGWTGEILNQAQSQDYLMVVDTNLQGQKSDARIEQNISHKAEVQEDGSIIDTVTISRKHSGQPGEMFYGGKNINYIRIYVPEGSELLDAGGFQYPREDAFKVPVSTAANDIDLLQTEQEVGYHAESGTRITNEFGKTVFGNWMAVDAGNSSSIYFKYKIPMQVAVDLHEKEDTIAKKWKTVFLDNNSENASRYSILMQKQSGVNSKISSNIIYPEGWNPVWRSSDEIELGSNQVFYNGDLLSDIVIGVVMKNNNK